MAPTLLFLLLLLAPPNFCGQFLSRFINIALLIPKDDFYLSSYNKVVPGIDSAIATVVNRTLLHRLSLVFRFSNTRCSNIYAPVGAIESYKEGFADVFFGPSCDYALAPVARFMKFWDMPLMTGGGLVHNFSKNKTNLSAEFYGTIRTGLTFRGISKAAISVLNKFNWKKLLFLYEPDGHSQVTGPSTCRLFGNTFIDAIRTFAKLVDWRAFD
ncbi:hypothetical protein QYM36_017428, partial [Artemia franciscana]